VPLVTSCWDPLKMDTRNSEAATAIAWNVVQIVVHAQALIVLNWPALRGPASAWRDVAPALSVTVSERASCMPGVVIQWIDWATAGLPFSLAAAVKVKLAVVPSATYTADNVEVRLYWFAIAVNDATSESVSSVARRAMLPAATGVTVVVAMPSAPVVTEQVAPLQAPNRTVPLATEKTTVLPGCGVTPSPANIWTENGDVDTISTRSGPEGEEINRIASGRVAAVKVAVPVSRPAVASSVIVPGEMGVTRVEIVPLASVVKTQGVVRGHAENIAEPFVTATVTFMPVIGVTLSPRSNCTLKGNAAGRPVNAPEVGALTTCNTSGTMLVKLADWERLPCVATTVIAPPASGIMLDDAMPSTFVTNTHAEDPHAVNRTLPEVAEKVTILPAMGVTPSPAISCTAKAGDARVPDGTLPVGAEFNRITSGLGMTLKLALSVVSPSTASSVTLPADNGVTPVEIAPVASVWRTQVVMSAQAENVAALFVTDIVTSFPLAGVIPSARKTCMENGVAAMVLG
jgi:hypothetical protein